MQYLLMIYTDEKRMQALLARAERGGPSGVWRPHGRDGGNPFQNAGVSKGGSNVSHPTSTRSHCPGQ